MKKEYDFRRGRRGPAGRARRGKARITIRLDEEIIQWFREEVHDAGGGSYQTLINDALREHIRSKREPLEETFRRVLREELLTLAARARGLAQRTRVDQSRRERRQTPTPV